MTSLATRLAANRATYRPPAAEHTNAAGGVKHSTAELVLADVYRNASREGWTPDEAAAEVMRRLGLDGAA